MQTILLKVTPQEYVKDMRDKLTEGKFENDYHGFEQELFDQICISKNGRRCWKDRRLDWRSVQAASA